jgi:hypothetical protein
MTDSQRARQGYTADNLECARVILASEAKYGGPESLAVQWARAVVANSAKRIEGPLFKETRAA